MKRRLLSFFLTFCLLLAMVPALVPGASAEELDEEYIVEEPAELEPEEEIDAIVDDPVVEPLDGDGSTVIASGYCGGEDDGTNLTWTLTDDGTLIISGEGEMADYEYSSANGTTAPWGEYKSSMTTLVLEDGITTIGIYAFSNCSGFTGNLAIPGSVTSIDGGAFYGCSGFIGDLVIPDSVTSINGEAFRYCSGFTGNLVIPDSVDNIGVCAFASCSGFDGNLVLSNSLTSIEAGVFQYCNGFTGELVIPSGVTNIGNAAFEDCSGFSGELLIPESVTYIGSYTFASCSGFTGDLIIPDGVTGIEAWTFNDCAGLSGRVFFAGNAPTIVGLTGVYPSFDADSVIYYISGTTGWTESKYYDADAGTWNGYKLGTWDGVNMDVDPEPEHTVLASGYCGGEGDGTNLTWTLTDDGTLTISGTGAMADYKYNSSNLTTAPWAEYKSSMTTLVLEDGITTIGIYAFRGCSGFTGDLVIPDSVTSIGEYAFTSCSGFTGDLVIPDSVTSIGYQAFSGCIGFTGDLVIGDSVTSIGNYAFSGCRGFTGDLVIGDSVTSIGNEAFYNCSGFTGNLVIGDSVASIGSSAFRGCSGFTGDLVIPDSVTSIGSCAFQSCSGFTGDLVIGDSVTSIGNFAFERCRGFTGDLVIGNSVTSIGDYAFSLCGGFTGNLVIGNSVTSIGSCAFNYCSGFTGDLVIPDSVTIIEEGTFSGCSGFNGTLKLPNSLVNIKHNAFYGCSGLKGNLIIPATVKNIGNKAFAGCTSLSGRVYFDGNAPAVVAASNSNASFTSGTTLLYIPETTGWTESSAYDADAGTWNGYKLLTWDGETTEEYTHSLTQIPAKAATCTEVGNIEYWYCSGCGKYFSDEAATAEITLADTVTPALGHDYREGSCARCGEPDADWDPNAPKLAVCSTVGRIGKTVEVQVNMTNNPGLTGMVTMVTFDSNVLEYVSCQVAEQFVGMSDSYLDGNTVRTVWVTTDEAVTGDGTFMTMVFNVKEDAPDGDTYIYLDYEYKNTIDENDERVELVTENGTVTVVAGFLGDVNDDGEVTTVDARWLLQYLSGAREFTEEQLLLADVNGDGEVTAVDARWVLQRLSGARDENFQAR